MSKSIITKSGIPEAPQDTKQYARKDGAWSETTSEVVGDGVTITGTGTSADPLVAIVTEGPQGEQGIQGEQGEQGIQGEQGEIGEIGETGEQGIQGETGADSTVAGPQGEPGVDGVDGLLGVSLAQCRLYVDSDQSITAAADVKYDITMLEDYNNNTGYYSITSGVVTFLISGYYVFNYGLASRYEALTSSSFPVLYLTGDSDVTIDNKYSASTGITGAKSYSGADGTYTGYVTAGDTIKLRIAWNGGASTGAIVRFGTYMSITSAAGVKGDTGTSGIIPSTAATITTTDIDWSVDATYSKLMEWPSTFTFSNTSDGMIVTLVLVGGTSDISIWWPSTLKWPDNTSVDEIPANTTIIFTFIGAYGNIYATYAGDYV